MKQSLAVKIWFSYSLILLLVAVFMLYLYPKLQEEQLTKNKVNEIHSIAKTIALGVEIAIETEDFSGVKKSLDFAASDSNIVRTGVFEISDDSIAVFKAYANNKKFNPNEINTENYFLARQNFETNLFNGEVVIVYDKSELKTLIKETNQIAYLFVFVLFVLSTLAFYFIALNISKPINQISQLTKQVSEGDYNQPLLSISRSDEIGELQSQINTMIQSLQVEYNNNQSLQEELEERIEARTKELNDALENLRKADVRTRSIVNNALDAVVTINESGNIIEWNSQAENMFGYTKEEVLNQPLHHFIIPSEMVQSHVNGMDHYHKTKEGPVLNKRIEINAKRKNGEHFLTELSITPIKEGENTIFSAFIRDITDKKAAETQLIESKKELEDALKVKESFVSVMSHEIRTPLNSIIGMAHLLNKKPHTAEQIEIIETLQFASKNLLALINDILDYSKINAGALELEKTDFNLRKYIHLLNQQFKGLANDKGLELTESCDPEIPQYLKGDPTRITQILSNLISNSIKFTKNGSVALNCKLESINNSMVYLTFEVADTGIGIAKNQIKKIFEPFKQADSSINRQFGGTGLGLSIVKNLVEIHGGTLTIESQLGHGSTFKFTIPFEISANQDTEEVELDHNVEYNLGLKILYVEDVLANQFLLKGITENWGIELVLASSGEEALAIIQQTEFDVILMDIQMPVLDGIETTALIRKSGNPYCAEIPIIAFTAHAGIEVARALLKKGFNDVITKPVNPDLLFNKLNDLFQKNASRRPRKSKENRKIASSKSVPPKNAVLMGLSFAFYDSIYASNSIEYVELLKVIIDQLTEDQSILVSSLKEQDFNRFSAARHKIYPTIESLDAVELKVKLKGITSESIKNEKINAETQAFINDSILEIISAVGTKLDYIKVNS